MRFESGMAGFLIVVLAVSGAIFGTIVLNSSESTQEVTKYDFKTEVTGLFPVDTSPEFYDYDLSRNYTGYFTEETQINGVNYFGGATFRGTGVNNYPIKTTPDNRVTSDETITPQIDSNLDNFSSSTYTGINYYDATYGNRYSFTTQSYTRTLESLVSELVLDDYDVIEIRTDDDISDKYHWSFFGTGDQFSSDTIPKVNYVNKTYFDSYPSDNGYYIACHSVKIDMVTGTVSYYYDDTISSNSYVYQGRLSDAVISYSTIPFYDTPTGIPLDVTAYDTNVVQYMDISQGVMVTGVTE